MSENVNRWQVTRFCCTSGLCVECHARGNHGDVTKRERLVHMDRITRALAEQVAANWSEYGALVSEMPAPGELHERR